MASDEILRMRGRLATAEKALRLLDAGIDVDIADLRIALDRHAPKNELDDERIDLVANRLCAEIRRRYILDRQITEIKRDLGDD